MSILLAVETATHVQVAIEGKTYKIVRDHKDKDIILELCESYNSTKDIHERKQLTEKLLELLKSKYKSTIEKDDRFTLDADGQLYFDKVSTPIPRQLGAMIKKYIDEGIDVQPLVNFWMLLSRQEDEAVIDQLFGFLEHNGHPITKHGYFVAYKAVAMPSKYDPNTGEEILKYDENTGELIEETPTSAMTFKPFHSGKHGMSIDLGKAITMPREECDSDPNKTCSTGLHVGSMAYVGNFGHSDRVILECLINPRNVVAVPTDYNNTKMRVCEYYPISVTTGENLSIYLESDYVAYEKEEVLKELEARKAKKEELIQEIVDNEAEHENILKELY